MTLTSFFALEPSLVWGEWDRVMKTLFMIFAAVLVLRTENDIKGLAWVIALSLGFYGLKGGFFTLATGGGSHVFGPEASYIQDNNALALALIMTIPIMRYLQLSTEQKWLRLGLSGLTFLTAVSAIGSYSRGALLAGTAMLCFLWIKSRNKFRTGIAVALIVPLAYLVMPEKWFGRMETIDNYSEDASALGRINAWHFATRLAMDNVMGGGFNVFTPKMFLVYAPNPLDHHAAHSIYFQVLGEHGFIGLALFLLFMLFTWRTGTRIGNFCKNKAELKWAADLAAMCQVSFIGFAVGGAFLSLAYYDLFYYIVALLILLEKLLILDPKNKKGNFAQTPLPIAQGPANQEITT
jgi:probable O-glycosylation ligase (exosortase A-associated)